MDRQPLCPARSAPANRRFAPLAVALLALALRVALPDAAAAHGGQRVLRAAAGPYAVEAVVSRDGDTIDETIDLTDATTGRPIAGALVALTLERHADPPLGPFVAEEAAGRYESHYPPPSGDRWSVLIRIQGPAGDAEARHPYRAPAGGRLWSGRTATILNVLILVVIASMPFVLPRIGRSARRSDARRSDDRPRPAA